MGRAKNVLALVVVLLIAATLSALRKPHLVMLYPKDLHQSDLSPIVQTLEEAHFRFSLDSEERFLFVEPEFKCEIRSYLIERGLPTGVDTGRALILLTPDDEKFPREKAIQKALEQQELEKELTLNLRGLTAVKDAMVKIGAPDKVCYRPPDAEKILSLRVFLQLEKDARLSSPQIQAMAATCALSVPMLKTKNIKMIDSSGRSLYDTTKPQE